MILKGSQRGGARGLAAHLLRTDDNDHVELHDVRGFLSNDLAGALLEAYGVSRGTRCKQFLFSLSLNPPENESVSISAFEDAIGRVEQRMGLHGQPRVIVFHEKEGRRHAHAVWSRIDIGKMKAINLPHFKLKLGTISRSLYIDHGWQMPKGLINSKERDPMNFTLQEWQQAKRTGIDPKEMRAVFQECWAASDSKAAFEQALRERGFSIARGDQRSFVAVDFQGEVYSIPRLLGLKTKEVRAKLGDSDALRSVDETKAEVSRRMIPALERLVRETDADLDNHMRPLRELRDEMKAKHRLERSTVDEAQQIRAEREHRDRQARFARGLKGLWHKISGRHRQIQAQNEHVAAAALDRDRDERQSLIDRQLEERQRLQTFFKAARQRHTRVLTDLRRKLAQYEDLSRTQPVLVAKDFERASRRRHQPRPMSREYRHDR